MSYQAVLHQQQTAEAISATQKIEATRNSVIVGHGRTTAGLTARDNFLRTVQVQLGVDDINRLIEELKIARAHLEAAALLSSLRTQL